MAEKKKKETEEVKEEVVETVEKKVYDELNDSYLRLLAEFTNYKNRTAKEKTTIFGDGEAFAISSILPVIDTLDLAASSESKDPDYKKGVLMTLDNLRAVFEKMGVSEINEVGVPFDPNFHNAVLTEENEEFPENTVSAVFQKGYKLGDKVLRPATVKVANS
jgi:molecular chaperone GrpE